MWKPQLHTPAGQSCCPQGNRQIVWGRWLQEENDFQTKQTVTGEPLPTVLPSVLEGMPVSPLVGTMC